MLTTALDLAPALDRIVASLGVATKAARAYVFEFHAGGELDDFMDNTYEWCAEGIEAQRDQLQAVPISVFAWWVEEIRADRAIVLPTLDALPPAAAAERELLAAQDIVELLAVAIRVDGRARGFLGLDAVGEAVGFDATTRAAVEHAAAAVANLLASAERAELRARELEERIRRFADLEATAVLSAGLVHDLANLLVMVSLHSELLLAQVGKDAREREGLEDMLALGDRAGGLLRRLLTLLGGKGQASGSIELDAAVGELARMLARAFEPGVAVEVGLRAADARLSGPASLLDQALLNLMVNARDAAKGGKVRLSTRLDADAGEALIRVEDSGPGIPAELRERVFAPFFTTKGKAGTGLGLYNVKHAVEQLGGRVDVIDGTLGGACFELRLPIERRPAQLGELIDGALARGGARLLIAEDERALMVMLRRALEQIGFTIHAEHQAGPALAALASFSPDVVLVDLHLDGDGGLALVREALARDPAPTVVGTTTDPTSDMARRAVELGAELLLKPFRRDVLEGLLRRTDSG